MWWTYSAVGKNPGELMDYVEIRLQGHPNIERLALPILGYLRTLLNQPARADLLKRPFQIPQLAKLVLADNATVLDPSVNLTPPAARTLKVGPFEEFRTIASAAKSAKDNDVVEIRAGEYHGDVAVWHQKKLTIRTRGGRARLYADGKAAEGKAIWVIRNGDFYISGIEFVGAQVEDRNGAGIRFEGGNLQIKNCLFYGGDNGLLTTGSAGSLEIESSEFAYNGFGDGQSHNLYVGAIQSLKIAGSYFHHANVGHLIKSRAQTNEIYYNRITDESGGRASYEIDLPNGGISYVVGNIIQQGVEPQNSTLIAYGAEGLAWPENRLYIASNTIVNDQSYGGTFLLTAKGTQRLVMINNLLIGEGKVHRGKVDVESVNNIRGDWTLFERASRYDYRLKSDGAKLRFTQPTLPEIIPRAEYIDPNKFELLKNSPLYPGAIQRN